MVAAVVKQESNWHPKAVSGTGHTGLGQLSPLIAKAYGVTDRKDPYQNLKGTAGYLAHNMKTYKRVDLSLADYHCGASAVRRANGRVPNCHDKTAGITTPQYVASVMKKAGL